MDEEKIEQISRSTNAISEWSIQLLTDSGIPENWVKYFNLLLLLSVLVLLVFNLFNYKHSVSCLSACSCFLI